jgi:hypothetical protein
VGTYKKFGGNMQVGDLVKIRRSNSRKSIGKLAIVVERYCVWNATIFIVDTGKKQEYDTRKLELVKKCP